MRMTATSKQPAPPPAPTYDEIAARAYAHYLDRGMRPGLDVMDWLTAELELQRELGGRDPVEAA